MSEPPPARSCGCPECGERFDTGEDLYRHRKTHPKPREGLSTGAIIPLACPECGERFDAGKDLYRHRKITHGYGKPREGLSTGAIILLVILAIVIIGFGTCLAVLSGAY